MAIQILSSDSSGTGIRADLGTSNDAYVRAGRLIASSTSMAILGIGSDHEVTVAGEVVGLVGGIKLGDSTADELNSVSIAQSGMVSSLDTAITLKGTQSKLTNYGDVVSDGLGVSVAGINVKVANFGNIRGDVGVVLFSTAAATTLTGRIENFGTIAGTDRAISGSDSIDLLSNYGKMSGGVTLIGGNDGVTNRGVMVGNVSLGTGNDMFDNRNGIVSGTISGDAGSDVFRPGAGSETIDGGADIDTLDFRGTAAVQVSLDGSVDGTGNADDDTYTGIERIFGSNYGDLLVGDTGLNTLSGFGGKDSLSGGAGGDVLIGGSGVDVLTGGAGSDQFVFNRASEAGDLISDFTGTGSSADFIFVAVSGFAGDLLKGALAESKLQIRADNLAQDSNDRFILRTTDKTLWYDQDGSGVEAAFLLADLQSSATLTAANIVLI